MKDNIDNSGNGFFGKSVTSWCSPPNGPPNNNVIPFEEAENKKWLDEIKEIESHFQDTDSFSQDRSQLLLLLSAIVLNPKIDIKVRKQACHTVVRHSNLRLLIESALCGCDDCQNLQDAQKGFKLVDKAFAAQ